jgi:TolB-like protein
MRKTTFALAAVAALALPAMAMAQAPDTRPTVAVLALDNGGAPPDMNALGKGFQDMLITHMAGNNRIRLVERSHLQAVLDEQKLTSSGQVDAQTAIKLGKLLNAHYLIAGSFITQGGKEMIINVRGIKTETGEIVYTDGSARGPMDKLFDLIIQTATTANTKLNLPRLEPNSAPAREAAAATEKAKKVPFQALLLYSRAVDAEDKGQKGEALTLYKQAVAQFPEYDAAKKAVDKLSK